MPASAPVTLSIPDLGVTTELMTLGRDANGEAEVPPGEAGSPAGWYKFSPTPGELGPSVILGHVNTTTAPEGVFYGLHELSEGQQFSVTRADGTVAVFAVDRSEVFNKDAFPTLAVYGNTDRAEIRLITCGGYEPSTGEFTENTVVYGHLLSSHTG
ncbi:MAG: class F sortase [Specibacter sp.]